MMPTSQRARDLINQAATEFQDPRVSGIRGANFKSGYDGFSLDCYYEGKRSTFDYRMIGDVGIGWNNYEYESDFKQKFSEFLAAKTGLQMGYGPAYPD